MSDSASTTTIAVQVRSRRSLTDRIDEFTLTPVDGEALPAWTAGSHIDVTSPGGIIRQYSLCSSVDDLTGYRVAVEHRDDSRGGSASIHASLNVGDTTDIGAPRNHFPLTRALEYVFVAGGVGITPILALIEATELFGRPWRLIYSGRTITEMAYAAELAARHPDRVTIQETSVSGRVDFTAALTDLPPGTAVYVCGPPAMVTDVTAACVDLRAVDVFAEKFVATGEETLANTAFEVDLAMSGLTTVVPEDKTILDVLDDAGVVTVSSCRDGICGTCEVGVVSGEVDHRDTVLTPEERAENESMMICVSRCTSGRLVLEL
ncbi:2Fe-2S iron-sulfur cluster binding domain-containing protein [Gordonia amarae]|uniref:2Fe-2S iron-sulfur cluster binding domain-containing protein n=2 Tax=Gordonia amarae TaxID=36821 RepID=A0A857LTS2_9ACTN|nr:PDR/VanB family oxidoreductase [Gordonia amarae]MCS3878963.1 ferredoxin-NADP reductase [Gordonia amarae]QHN17510.1 2Fe-2S iron-sulfur cluster binding domain-containing protein [Gordonia amarae]QHN22036.1 2Fe-2S iron-sulfur cluster binding domain-containing protein [Gordonia amarae]QHN30917.1 2Fe-2S iron-sulfur cluster binding domain-containing protein [Gordonia amarae]QHN39663.1 2Fe-2S iron-sulfur cluster binding domain-containing protein [Gordonia amarae]